MNSRIITLVFLLASVAASSLQAQPSLFDPIADAILSPRCLNCHTAREFPTQTDDRIRHAQQIIRGETGFGAPTLQCGACHQDENRENGAVPGANNWHLAPLSMAWETIEGAPLDRSTLCEVFKDRNGNGDRSPQDLVEHVENDFLVLWGFAPGAQRTLPGNPVDEPDPSKHTEISHDEFVASVQAWADAGAPCP